MSSTVETSRTRNADITALVIGLVAVGFILWGQERFPRHAALRTVGLAAGGLALVGMAVAVWASSRGRRPRLLTAIAALVNLGVIPFAMAVSAMLPQEKHFALRAIGEVRTVLAAQRSYKEANGGYYDSQVQCLMRPAACIPGYPADRRAFLSQESLSTPRAWYAFSLRSGPTPSPLPGAVSRTSVASYAYVAAPVDPSSYASWGVCGDSTGAACCTTDGTTPKVSSEGTCVLGQCRPLD